tara:strand:+ start:154 stop:345 length:192 start_codon:yes stop_codon:yes gene_type:complete
MKRFLERLREQMTTGGNPADPQIGSAGNIAGVQAPLGTKTPIVDNLGNSGNNYIKRNQQQSGY